MRDARRAAAVLVALAIAIAVALPAGASQRIKYNGENSQGGKVQLLVLKKRSGVRVLRYFTIRHLTVTCEDASTSGVGVFASARERLTQDGTFDIVETNGGGHGGRVRYTITGEVRFRSAAGAFEFRYATLDDGGEAQLCTTGMVDWSAERRAADTARPIRSPRDDVAWFENDRLGDSVRTSYLGGALPQTGNL